MSTLFRHSAVRFPPISVFALLLACCVSPDGGHPPVETFESDAVPPMTLDGSNMERNIPEPSGTAAADADVNPHNELERLWTAGRVDAARDYFRTAGLDGDLRRLWRSRLYMEMWRGYDMGLAGENVSALLAHRDDVWMGTWTGGLSRFSRPLENTVTFDPGLPSLAVRTVNRILQDGSRVAVVRYGEIIMYDGRSAGWKPMTGLPVSERLQDYRRHQGIEYLATLGDGFWRNAGNGWERMKNPGLFINRIESGEQDELLLTTMDRGLYVYHPADASWERPPDERVRYVNVTSVRIHGPLIIAGTYGDGAFVWNRSDGTVTLLDERRLGDRWVLAVAERDGWIYFATFGAGLAAWNIESDIWENFGIEDGLPTADLASLAVDDEGALWIGTLGGGIVRMEQGIHGD